MLLFHVFKTEGPFDDLLDLALTGDTIGPLYKGPWDTWHPHHKGVAINIEERILLNGKDVLFGGTFDEYHDFRDGVMTREDNTLSYGNTTLHNREFEGWSTDGEDFYVDEGNKILRNGTDYVCNSKCYEWEPWPGKRGVVIQRGAQDQRLFFNNKDIAHKGKFEDWGVCQSGIITLENGQLIFDKKIIYDGPWDNWMAGPHGLVIERDDELILVVIK